MLNECYRCGISGDKAKLYHAVSNKGIVKICGDCNSIEKFPIMKKPTEEQISESKNPRQASVSERLNAMNRNRLGGNNITLRTLVDKNRQSQIVQLPSDLIPNFHWTIQRIRRARKISREEFAKGINEPESTIRMIEQGLLPEENYKIINKIEGFLKISLRKPSSGFPNTDPSERFILDNSLVEKAEPKQLNFDRNTVKNLKIEDLKEMKKKEENKKNSPSESWEEEYSQDDEQFLDAQEKTIDEDDF